MTSSLFLGALLLSFGFAICCVMRKCLVLSGLPEAVTFFSMHTGQSGARSLRAAGEK